MRPKINYFYCREQRLLISTLDTNMDSRNESNFEWEKVPYKRAKKIAKRLGMVEELDKSFSMDLPF